MGEKTDKSAKLSQADRDFIKQLVLKNRVTIAHTVRVVLGELYGSLYEDCIGETYLLACQKVKHIREHENPDGFIIVAAKLTALGLMRKVKGVKTVPIVNPDALPSETDVYEEALFNICIKQLTPKNLEELFTPREAEVFKLIYIEELNSIQAAERLGISDSTVRSIKQTVKDKVKQLVKKNYF